jgi:hypothetical protein
MGTRQAPDSEKYDPNVHAQYIVVVHSLPWDASAPAGSKCPGYGLLDVLIGDTETFGGLLERLQELIPSPVAELIVASNFGWVDNTGKPLTPHGMFPKSMPHYQSCQAVSEGKSLAYRHEADPEDVRPIVSVPNLNKFVFAVLREQDVVRIWKSSTASTGGDPAVVPIHDTRGVDGESPDSSPTAGTLPVRNSCPPDFPTAAMEPTTVSALEEGDMEYQPTQVNFGWNDSQSPE